MPLRAPFPYFGGKSAVADLVWSRFGRVKQYLEPFAGSAAMLLRAPASANLEVLGDADHYIANFWRAVRYQPDAVAAFADYPVIHVDLTARHRWLVDPERVAALRESLLDAEWPGDAQIAGWWVWGQCAWIGSGWCAGGDQDKIPHYGSAGQGINRMGDQVPHYGDAGRGINRMGDQVPFHGHAGQGINRTGLDIASTMRELSDRLRRVVVINGDWMRCVNTHYGLHNNGVTAAFFDPPYLKYEHMYSYADPVARAVEAWCRERGDEKRLRIALCGHVGDYDLPGWDVVEWSRPRLTYGSDATRDQEAIWFSPGCLPSTPAQGDLFGA